MKQFLISLFLGGALAVAAPKIRNSDIATNASIVYTKLAALGNNSVLISSGSGVVTTNTALNPGGVLFANTSGTFGQNNSVLFWNNTNNRLGVGMQPGSGATLDVGDTTGGIGFPILTDAQRNMTSFARAGVVFWNSDNLRFEFWNGSGIGVLSPPSTPISLVNGGTGASTTIGGTGHVLASNAAGTAWVDSTVPVVASQTISALNIDWSTGNIFKKTLAANTAFTFSGKSDGQTIIVKVRNPSTFTVTWPQTLGGESVMWTGSVLPTASTGNKVSVYTIFFTGDELVGSFIGNF